MNFHLMLIAFLPEQRLPKVTLALRRGYDNKQRPSSKAFVIQ